MKNLFFLLMLFLTLTTCKKVDSCANIICKNGGTCQDGACHCPTGYFGTNCEKVTRSFFIGTYNCRLVGNFQNTHNANLYLCTNINFNFDKTFIAKIAADTSDDTKILIDSIPVFTLGNHAYGYLVTPYKFDFNMQGFKNSNGCTFGLYCGSERPIGVLNGNTITITGNSDCTTKIGSIVDHTIVQFVCTMVKQ